MVLKVSEALSERRSQEIRKTRTLGGESNGDPVPCGTNEKDPSRGTQQNVGVSKVNESQAHLEPQFKTAQVCFQSHLLYSAK